MIRKDLRRRFHPVGWSMLGYYLLLNIVALGVVFAALIIQMVMIGLNEGMGAMESAAETLDVSMSALGWGHILAVLLGTGILLLWKKPSYFRREILAKGRPMTVGAFFGLLCVFLGVQLVTSILNSTIEMILNLFDLTMLAALESASGMSDCFSMFLYASLLAPITEELLFRGLILRSLMPYGKKFAVLCSAFLFGIYHGNLAQTPFAFLAGLVLGYVASEYNIIWAMVIHMVNNLVLADMLSRLTSFLPAGAADAIVGIVILLCGIGAAIILIVNHRKIGAYLRGDKINKLCLQALFSHPGVIILAVLTFLSGLTLFSRL